MELFCHLLIAVFIGYGMAVILVEKKRQWPVRRNHLIIRKLLGKVHRRLPKMLDCTVCTSFWTTLVAEIALFIFDFATSWHCGHAVRLWLWPLSGFVAAGFTWTVMDILRSGGFIADALTIISSKKP